MKTLEQYGLVSEDGRLVILGVCHGAPPFYEAAVSLAAQCDRVLLELPRDLPVETVMAVAEVAYPYPSLVVIPEGEAEIMLVPVVPGRPTPCARRPVYRAFFLPLASFDAMAGVLHTLAREAHKVQFMDAGLLNACCFPQAEAPENRDLRLDPQELLHCRDFAEFHDRWKAPLAQWPVSDYGQFRNACMAGCIRDQLRQHPGERILAICGLSHVAPLMELVYDPQAQAPVDSTLPYEPSELRCCTLSPSLFYSWGLMDLPFLIRDYAQRVAQGNLRYEREDLVTALLTTTYDQVRRFISPRSILNAEAYLARLTLASGRWSADFDGHILPAATAAAGADFAQRVEETAMALDWPPPRNLPEGTVFSDAEGMHFIEIGSEVFLLASTRPKDAEPRPLRRPRATVLTPEEQESLNACGGVKKKPDPERHLTLASDQEIQALGRTALRRFRLQSRKGQGPLRGRIDWMRTVKARAQGDKGLWLKIPRPLADPATDDPDWWPLVVAYAASSSGDRFADYYYDDREDDARRHMFATFFWMVKDSRRRVGPGVVENRVAFRLRLLPSEFVAHDRARTLAYIDRIPPHQRCFTEIWNDPALRPFRGLALAMAGGVAYARDHVIILNATGQVLHLDPAVCAFAEQRGVQLVRLEAAQLDHALWLERLHYDTEVPAPDPYHPPLECCARFARPTPFDHEHETRS